MTSEENIKSSYGQFKKESRDSSLKDIVEKIEMPEHIFKQYKEFEKEYLLDIDSNKSITANGAAVLTNKLLQVCNGAIYD